MSKTPTTRKGPKDIDGGMDWTRAQALTEDEINAAARTDPDNPPMSKEEAARMRRISLAKHVRQAVRLSQDAFARRYGIPIETLRAWEEHRQEPTPAETSYLRVIQANPSVAVEYAV